MENVNVTVRLDTDILKAIDHIAKLDDRSRAYVIRSLITEGLARRTNA